jgi:hypothetical protein
MKFNSPWRALALFVAAVFLLFQCVYIPGPGEIKAKRDALAMVHWTLESLPKPGDFTVAKSYGTDRDDVKYYGNYRGKYAHATARYLTSLPPDEACRIYLRYVEAWPLWTHNRPPCTGTGPNIGISVFERFTKKRMLSYPLGAQYSLFISLRPPPRPPGVEASGSEISVRVHYAVDERARAECTPAAEKPGPAPCDDAEWKGLDQANQVARKAVATGRRAARTAGKRPPIRPMAQAQITPMAMSPGVNAMANTICATFPPLVLTTSPP